MIIFGGIQWDHVLKEDRWTDTEDLRRAEGERGRRHLASGRIL